MRQPPLVALCSVVVAIAAALPGAQTANVYVQFIFTADSHYGITRTAFRGSSNVDAHTVNRALVASINALPGQAFDSDGGVRSGKPVGALDFVVVGGDVVNREEVTDSGPIQSAAASWAQFATDYVNDLTVRNRTGARSPLQVIPGNHEASNAVGFYRHMFPLTDKTAMVEIYNRMMMPSMPKTTSTYEYSRDKVLTTRDIGGIHFMYLTVWPDSRTRAWMNEDIRRLGRSTPVVVFTHDQPDVESKHFINPNGHHDVNERDKFENVLDDQFVDGGTITAPSLMEQDALEDFLRDRPNITAYFHGNSNWNQFYDWTGPRHTIALHTFRVDSPMKGAISSKDETKLSFQIATIDTMASTMTVRECLWNVDTTHPTTVTWGDSTTVSLAPRVKSRFSRPSGTGLKLKHAVLGNLFSSHQYEAVIARFRRGF